MSAVDGVAQVAGQVAAKGDVPLGYTVASSSGHVGAFHPNLVLEDRPNDSRSRWTSADVPSTGAGHSPHAYLILQLHNPAIVRTISFGKHTNPNPCNLADFKVYALPMNEPASSSNQPGTNASWVRVLRNGLRNDSQPETFSLRHRDEAGAVFATYYLMVVPLQAFAPKYHFTIWHLALRGVTDPHLVQSVLDAWQEHISDLVLRLAAKHMRTTGHLDAFQALLASANLGSPSAAPAFGHEGPVSSLSARIQAQLHPPQSDVAGKRPFEHPIVARLFDSLVLHGDFDAAEECLEQAACGDQTEESASALLAEGAGAAVARSPTLFERSAARTNPRAQWTCTVPDSRARHAVWPESPIGRAGAAMAVDPVRGVVYLHGGWSGSQELGDLWTYTVADRTWRSVISTADPVGPGPRSCHCMSWDARSGIIYLLGRFVDVNLQLSELVRSTAPDQGEDASPMDARRGLARTEAILDQLLQTVDRPHLGPVEGRMPSGMHSPGAPGLGWPSNRMAADLWGYSTRTGRWTCYSHDVAAAGGPMLMYQHQMAVDPDAQMMYVFGGYTVNPDAAPRVGDRPRSGQWLGMWKYDLVSRAWAQLFDDSMPGTPPSRAGHAMVLEPSFGRYGLPGQGRRLWILGGHRADRYFDDVWTYDLHTNTCAREQVFPDPSAGFPIMGTPHASIDVAQSKIYLFTAELPSRTSSDTLLRARNSLWVLDLSRRTWARVWQSRNKAATLDGAAPDPKAALSSSVRDAEPTTSPRSRVIERQPVRRARSIIDAFGTQPVGGTALRAGAGPAADGDELMGEDAYPTDDDDVDLGLGPYIPPGCDDMDTASAPNAGSSVAPDEAEMSPRSAQAMAFVPHKRGGEFILFGGTPPGQSAQRRLGDTWQLSLVHAPVEDLLRQARFLVRQHKFTELLAAPTSDQSATTRFALAYLQSAVASVVDQHSPAETATFRDLSAALLHPLSPAGHPRNASADEAVDQDDSEVEDGTHSPVPATGSAAEFASPVPAQTPLYLQRLALFRSLLKFFPLNATEPREDLAQAVSRMGFKTPM